MSNNFKNLKSLSLKVFSTITISSCLSSWWYRPVIDHQNGQGLRRIGWISQIDYQNVHCRKPPFLYQLTSDIITFIVVSASWIYLYAGGTYQVIDDENYQYFLEMIKNRDPDTPIMTVSNHRSLLDDPLILSALLPFWMNCQHKYLRWGACAQEICFKEEHLLASFIGVGKSLPMWRGGGLDQPLLLQFARKTVGSPEQNAEWIHVYPEAGVYQYEYYLGGRRENKDEHGKLKWGIGKLIAHHPTHERKNRQNDDSQIQNKHLKGPLVIPFYFLGTEAITPFTDLISRKVKYTLPQFGQKVTVRFGKPIYFHDLLDEFESNEIKNGKVTNINDALRVYHCCDNPLIHQHNNNNDSNNKNRNNDRNSFEYIFNFIHKTLDCSIYIVNKTIEKIIQKNPENYQNNHLSSVEIKNSHHNYNHNDNHTHNDNQKLQVIPKNLMYNLDTWKSTPSEKKLYHKITTRIENQLEKLGEECALDVKLLLNSNQHK